MNEMTLSRHIVAILIIVGALVVTLVLVSLSLFSDC